MTYPFRLPNYRHQQEEWDRFRDEDKRALLWQMRTGKTKATLDLACYRRSLQHITGVLILAPNGVHVNWVRRQLPQHMWETIKYRAHAWQASEAHKQSHMASLERCLSCPPSELAILAVNSESILHDKPTKLLRKFIKKHTGSLMLVVDESHDFRSPGAKRTKRARSLKKYCKIVRILTGTPVSNSPLAAYSQFELLADKALGCEDFEAFKGKYSLWRQERSAGGRQYPVLQEYINQEDLQAQIAKWASVVLREDVDDMPELILDERVILLPEALLGAYKTLLKEYILELMDGREVEALEGGVRLIKLQQILSGFVVDSEGNLESLVADEDNPRLAALGEEVLGSDRKIIVWCKYQEDIRKVTAKLKALGIGCVQYHGRIHSQAVRQQAIDDFNNKPEVRVFVGQPKAGGQGLDLSAADLIIWYSHTFDLIERDQANERATQIGGRTVTILDFVVPDSVDEYILSNLASKRSVSDALAGRGLRDRLLALFNSQL